MGIETDTLDDYFSHPALCRGDYACLYRGEKDQFIVQGAGAARIFVNAIPSHYLGELFPRE